MVRPAVFSDETGAVDPQHHVQLQKRHVMQQHIKRTLQKRRVNCNRRDKSLLCHAAGHRERVLLGDADIEEPVGADLREAFQSRSVAHSGSNGADARIFQSKLCERLAENV